ncbi:hypothetical protein Tco_1383514 [Tanacetum coccineum]
MSLNDYRGLDVPTAKLFLIPTGKLMVPAGSLWFLLVGFMVPAGLLTVSSASIIGEVKAAEFLLKPNLKAYDWFIGGTRKQIQQITLYTSLLGCNVFERFRGFVVNYWKRNIPPDSVLTVDVDSSKLPTTICMSLRLIHPVRQASLSGGVTWGGMGFCDVEVSIVTGSARTSVKRIDRPFSDRRLYALSDRYMSVMSFQVALLGRQEKDVIFDFCAQVLPLPDDATP